MQNQPIENLGSNTNVPADSELLVLKNGTLQRATIDDVLKNSSINSALTQLNGNLAGKVSVIAKQPSMTSASSFAIENKLTLITWQKTDYIKHFVGLWLPLTKQLVTLSTSGLGATTSGTYNSTTGKVTITNADMSYSYVGTVILSN